MLVRNTFTMLIVGAFLFLPCISYGQQLQRAIKLFDPIPAFATGRKTSPNQAKVFAEIVMPLTCNAGAMSTISSTEDGTGTIVVDNFIQINGINVCTGGYESPSGHQNCFMRALGPLQVDVPIETILEPIPSLDVSAAIPVGANIPVRFELLDFGGIAGNTALFLITECMVAPIASFSFLPESPKAGQPVTFDASMSFDLDGRITRYAWSFGDGSRAKGKIVTHTYVDNGMYVARLTATDEDGLKRKVRKSLAVCPCKKTFGVISGHPGGAQFFRNDRLFATGGRGFNVAAIRPNGKLLKPVQSYDSWATADTGEALTQMVAFLASVPNGTLLLIAVSDEAGLGCPPNHQPWTEAAVWALKDLGSQHIGDYCFRQGWALITVKGTSAALAEGLSDIRWDRPGHEAVSLEVPFVKTHVTNNGTPLHR
jgi:hypothetical protein